MLCNERKKSGPIFLHWFEHKHMIMSVVLRYNWTLTLLGFCYKRDWWNADRLYRTLIIQYIALNLALLRPNRRTHRPRLRPVSPAKPPQFIYKCGRVGLSPDSLVSPGAYASCYVGTVGSWIGNFEIFQFWVAEKYTWSRWPHPDPD
jgi:hypothetical protein